MGKLDELKDTLAKLQPGQAVKLHESDVAEALQQEGSPINVYPSTSMIFRWWCEDNGLLLFYSPVDDYVTFEKKVQQGV